MSARRKSVIIRRRSTRSDSSSPIREMLATFERAERSFGDGMGWLKRLQKDFDAAAANKNLYSHALRALRQIAMQRCEVGPWMQGHKNCNDAISAGDHAAKERCWPCFAREALQRGGDQ